MRETILIEQVNGILEKYREHIVRTGLADRKNYQDWWDKQKLLLDLIKKRSSSAPESGGEEKELWEEIINDINTLNKEGDWDKMYFSDMMKNLKKKFSVTRK